MPAPGAAFLFSVMNVYIDESGDLGFTHDKPFRSGGSSRFLTITFLLIPKAIQHHPQRIIRDIYNYRKRSPNNELKGSDLNPTTQLFFTNMVVALLKRFTDIRIFSITVNKANVEGHIRQDPNKLYNYMIGLILIDFIKDFPLVTFIPDKRSIKVNSGNSLSDYLQIKLWFDMKSKTKINNRPKESCNESNLQFVDFISHIIWSKYEDQENSAAYKTLAPYISEKHLFF